MSVSPKNQAILLLTAHFSKANKKTVKPLTTKEWGRFAMWMNEKSLTPEQLMTGRLGELLNGWTDKAITIDRVERLMNRGSALALATEKWLRAGLWIMTRSDPDYPKRFKQHLKTDSPAVLFGCGNRALLNGGGLAVVGSRNATETDLVFSRDLGALAAGNGYSIVSGGARGVDEAAMLGALEAEGTVIGVLADNLLRACSSAKYRNFLMANNLVLISTFYPEAGFNAGNAMQRNKYIYCLSDAAVAVHSGEKGGTWSGATENLKKQWVPLWVKPTTDAKAGNEAIIKAGAAWLSENIGDINFAALFSANMPATGADRDLFSQVVNEVKELEVEYSSQQPPESVPDAEVPPSYDGDLEFYDLFLMKVHSMCSDSPKTTDELVCALEINKTQLNVWLKRAVEEMKIKKLSRPVRYQWIATQQGKLPLYSQKHQ